MRQRRIRCEQHGRVIWRGDIVCADCGRIYYGDADGRPKAPDVCDCGKRLKPAEGDDLAEGFTARVICRRCANADSELVDPTLDPPKKGPPPGAA